MNDILLKRLLLLKLCGIALFYVSAAFATTSSYFEKVLIDNNLPNVGIYSITQDQNGYLWLASTNTGLMQFDGYQFQKHPLLNSTLTKLKSVPDIDAIAFDQYNNLWAGSWGYGLAKINAIDGSIALFNGESDALASPYVQTLFKDKQQRIWIGTTKGVNRYNDSDGLTRIDQPADPLVSRRIWAFAQTPDNKIWLATSAGLVSWQEGGGFSAPLFPHDIDSENNEIRALHVIGDELWVGTGDGLFVYQPQQNRFTQIHLPEQKQLPSINALTSSVEGYLLVGTFSGIYAVEPTKKRFVRRFQQHLVELEHINVRSFFIDKSQVTWVGTRENGLFFKTRQRRAFQNTSDAGLAALQQTISAPILSLLAEPDQLWFGQYGVVSHYSHRDGQTTQFAIPGRINVIRRAPDNSIWVGSDNGIFQRHDGEAEFSRYAAPYVALNLPQINARDIQFTDDNKTLINLWNNGILLIDNASGQVSHFLNDISRDTIGDAVQAMTITPEHIWLASRLSGIYLLNRRSLNITPLSQLNSSPLLTADFTGQITCLAHAPDNSLVVCSEQGVLRISLATGIVTLIDANAGLTGTSLVGAHTDRNNNIWILSTSGLDVLKPDGSLAHFNSVDGLNSDELMFNAVSEDQHQLYFGSDSGLELVDPSLLHEPLTATPQAISKVTFDRQQATNTGRLLPLQNIIVPASVSRVGFHFASFDYNNPKRNTYRYKLDGYDDDWQQLNEGNIASYTNLAPGSYRLYMQSGNNQRLSNGIISTLDIEVLPHWWQRRKVQFFAVLAVIMILAFIVKRRINQVHRVNALLQQVVDQKNLRQEVLEQAVTERTTELQHSLQKQQEAYDELQQLDLLKDQFISTVSHELRTPLTAISGALSLVLSGALSADQQKQQQLLHIANSNSKRLTLLINDLLDLEKLAANQMQFNLQLHDVATIVQRAIDEISTYGLTRKISLVLVMPEHQAPLLANVDENRLLQVLANLLSNAIKFSPAHGEVQIRLSVQQDNIMIAIADQGPGIAKDFQQRIFQRFAQESSGNTRAQGGTGLGLALSQELIHAMRGEISFISEPGAGATFYIKLPLQLKQ